VGKDVLLLVRPSGRRLAFEQHGKLVSPVPVAATEEVAAVVSMLVDISAIALTMLSVRTMHKCKPSGDVLQILGVLAQLDDWELLPCLAESSWRAALVACANAGGDLMRRICSIVYQLVPHATGQVPDALTYGCYLRALAAKKRHLGSLEPVSLGKANKSAPALFSKPEPEDAFVDAYLYLEEMGSTWYIQRSALQGQTLVTSVAHISTGSNASRNNPVSPLSSVTGAMTKAVGLGKRFPLSFRSADNSPGDLGVGAGDKRPTSIKSEATKLTSGQFSLAEGPGMLVYHRPITQLALYPPRQVREFTHTAALKPSRPQPGALSAELLTRMDQLYAGALPQIRRIPSASPGITLTHPGQTKDAARARNDSQASMASTVTTTTAGDTSPVNPNASTSRMSALSRRFFAPTKKAEPSSPVPHASAGVAANDAHVELTDTAHNSAPPPAPASVTTASPAIPAPASPNPFGWAKKLRPAMFFGGTPGSNKPDSAAKSPKRDVPDVELKVLSATLNFDDEDSGGENADAGDEDGSNDGEGDEPQQQGDREPATPVRQSEMPDWAILPSPAQSSPAPTQGTEGESLPVSMVPSSEATPVRGDTTTEPAVEAADEAAGDSRSISPLPDAESFEMPAEQDGAITPGEGADEAGETAGATENLLDLDSEAAVVVADESQLFDNNSDHPAETGAIQSAGSTEDVPSVDADIEAAKAKPVDVVTLQAQLLQAFEDEYAVQGRVLGIHSATPCPHCGCTMLDEEVLSRWCHGHAYEAHIKGNTRSPQARNMVAVHKITCKQCSEEFQPQLHVSCYAKDSNVTPESECSTPVSVAGHVPVPLQRLWAEEVSYLSPFGLRYEMESVLLQYGHTAFTTAWLHAHHPVLLWGILFYSCRVHLPSGLHHVSPANDFASSNGSEARSYLHPVVVGWRESTVKALASRVLTAKAYDFLTVRDIFPDCTEEDAAKLEQDVVPALDGSPAGMRIAMMEFSQCHSVMLYGQKAGFSAARLLNMGLLMMCYLYHKTHLTMPKHFETLAHLDKVSFSKIVSGCRSVE
jgi:hypothetical protein